MKMDEYGSRWEPGQLSKFVNVCLELSKSVNADLEKVSYWEGKR